MDYGKEVINATETTQENVDRYAELLSSMVYNVSDMPATQMSHMNEDSACPIYYHVDQEDLDTNEHYEKMSEIYIIAGEGVPVYLHSEIISLERLKIVADEQLGSENFVNIVDFHNALCLMYTGVSTFDEFEYDENNAYDDYDDYEEDYVENESIPAQLPLL